MDAGSGSEKREGRDKDCRLRGWGVTLCLAKQKRGGGVEVDGGDQIRRAWKDEKK